jgi:hypothetical protein
MMGAILVFAVIHGVRDRKRLRTGGKKKIQPQTTDDAEE